MNDDPTVLLTPQGQELLSRLAAEAAQAQAKAQAQAPGQHTTTLAQAERLRREYPPALVAAAMAQQELRQVAAVKFSRAPQMLFTRAGYEQSSSEAIAAHRAERMKNAPRIADLCCGIGGDLIALAASSEVLAVDKDPVHARLAQHNAAVYGRAGHVTTRVADVRDISLTRQDAVFIDPARRSGPGPASAAQSHRYKAGASEPPLDWCLALTSQVKGVCIKAAPGLPDELVPPGWEAEFIAEARDLKEAVLWSPVLATSTGERPRRATVLTKTAQHTLVARPGSPVPLREPGGYLLDPNPAVTRAGLVEDLARTLGDDTAKIDPRIAFLTLDREARTPFARTLKVAHSAPWNEKQFAKRLRDLGVGAVDIRRRGLAGDVDQIRRRLKLEGKAKATVVITRVNDKPWGLVCTDPE